MTALARRTSAAVYARIHFFVCLLRTFMHRITEWRALHAGDDTLSVAMTFESRHRCSPFTTLWCQWEICVGVCENARSMCVRSVCGGFVRNARMNPGYRIFWCFFFNAAQCFHYLKSFLSTLFILVCLFVWVVLGRVVGINYLVYCFRASGGLLTFVVIIVALLLFQYTVPDATVFFFGRFQILLAASDNSICCFLSNELLLFFMRKNTARFSFMECENKWGIKKGMLPYSSYWSSFIYFSVWFSVNTCALLCDAFDRILCERDEMPGWLRPNGWLRTMLFFSSVFFFVS